MWLEKQRRSWKNTCSRLAAGILLFLSIVTLTACKITTSDKTPKETKQTKKWEPLKITKEERSKAEKEVKEISKICQNIKIDKNKVTKKDLQNLYDTLTAKGYPTAQIGQESHSTKNAPVKFKPSKTIGILTTIYREEDGTLSISEMVKYKIQKLELNEKDILTLEFYLSDQAELQTDGTMEFQL